MGLTLGLILLMFVWFIAAILACRATVQRDSRARYILSTRESNIWAMSAYLLSAPLGIFAWKALSASTERAGAGILVIGAGLGVWATFIVLQLLTNYGRDVENLPREPFRWFPEERSLPIPPANQLTLEARTADRFVAMELMPLYWNRFYSVYIADRMLCGAKAQFGTLNIAFNSRSVARSIKFDPKGYVSTRTPSLYSDMDVTGPEFLTADAANFQIALSEISSIELKPSNAVKKEARFGLGGLRQSGALVLSLKSGTTRQLILLGDQDGVTLKERLEGLARAPVSVHGEASQAR